MPPDLNRATNRERTAAATSTAREHRPRTGSCDGASPIVPSGSGVRSSRTLPQRPSVYTPGSPRPDDPRAIRTAGQLPKALPNMHQRERLRVGHLSTRMNAPAAYAANVHGMDRSSAHSAVCSPASSPNTKAAILLLNAPAPEYDSRDTSTTPTCESIALCAGRWPAVYQTRTLTSRRYSAGHRSSPLASSVPPHLLQLRN